MIRGSARRGAALASAGLVLALLPTVGAEARDAEAVDTGTEARTRAASASAARTVTLVTGDKVTVTDLGGGRKTVTVERPRGATGAVRTQTANGAVTVVPDESLPYLRAGTVDQRLFDAGMEWVARDVGAEVVSMSLGSTGPSDGTDPMAQTVETPSRRRPAPSSSSPRATPAPLPPSARRASPPPPGAGRRRLRPWNGPARTGTSLVPRCRVRHRGPPSPAVGCGVGRPWRVPPPVAA